MCLSKCLMTSLVGAVWFFAGAAWGAELVKIRVSWIAPITNWASILLEKKDLAKHLGRSYLFEPVRYGGTPQMITVAGNRRA